MSKNEENKDQTKMSEQKAQPISQIDDQRRAQINREVNADLRAQLSPSARQLYDLIYKDET